jgi:hypothetical protein
VHAQGDGYDAVALAPERFDPEDRGLIASPTIEPTKDGTYNGARRVMCL